MQNAAGRAGAREVGGRKREECRGERGRRGGGRERGREHPYTLPTPPPTVNGLYQVKGGRRFKRSLVYNAAGSLGQKKGARQRMRVPKAKRTIRHYFNSPPPTMPSSTSSHCLHTNPVAASCMCTDMSISHQFLSAPIHRHPNSHSQQNSSCGPEAGEDPFSSSVLLGLAHPYSTPPLPSTPLALQAAAGSFSFLSLESPVPFPTPAS